MTQPTLAKPSQQNRISSSGLKLLADRRIAKRTILVFSIQTGKSGWSYPVPGGSKPCRFKAYNSRAEKKYAWLPGKPAYARFYHTPNFQVAVEAAKGTAWFVSGEADVWAAHSAGLENVFSGFGEGSVDPDLVGFLENLGVTTLRVTPDLDETGERWARRVASLLASSGVRLEAYRLPASLGAKGDIGKAWQFLKDSDANFEQWLLCLPEMEVNVEAETPDIADVGMSDFTQIPLEYREAVARALGVKGYNEQGWSSHYVLCPFHDDHHPSAKLHAVLGLYCYAEGQWYRWTDAGARLELGSLSTFLRRRSVPDLPTPATLATEVREELICRGLTNLARVLDALYLAGFQPGDAISVNEASSKCASFGLSRHTIYRVLGQPVVDGSSGGENFLQFFPPISFLKHVKPEESAKKSGRGRPVQFYRMPSPEEVARLVGVDPNWPLHYDELQASKIAPAKAYRAEIYAAFIRRHPGIYTRRWLAARLGVSARTTREYDRLGEIEVSPNLERKLLTPDDIARLPENRDELPGNVWIEDESRKPYPALRAVGSHLSQAGQKVYRVKRLANYYTASKHIRRPRER